MFNLNICKMENQTDFFKKHSNVKEVIENLDLGPIKYKMINSDEGKPLSEEQVKNNEKEYKRFLYLIYCNPAKSIVPTKEIDEFWHYHIMDTEKYLNDCDMIFGKIIHHFPYLGIRGEEDALELHRKFKETKDLYQNEFGQIYSAEKGEDCSACGSSSCAATSCGSECGNGKSIMETRPSYSKKIPAFA